MNSALVYSDDSDQELYSQTTIQLGGKAIDLLVATLASSPTNPNEDAFAASYQNDVMFTGIFDGTTSLKSIKSLGAQTGARFASHFLKNNFSPAHAKASPKELLLELNQKLLQKSLQFEGAALTDTHTLPSSTGTIIKIDAEKNSLFFAHVGDSYGIAYYVDGHSQVFTNDRNSVFDKRIFTLIAHIAKENGITPRQARQDERVKKALIEMFVERNNSPKGSGSGVINGDPHMVHYIQEGTFSLEAVNAILLGTDGLLPQGWSEHEEQDRQKLLNEIQKGGFQKLFRTKKESEDDDPDWKYI